MAKLGLRQRADKTGLSSRACDACFIRKIKCERPDLVRSIKTSTVADDDSTRPGGCTQCNALRMECTFDRPQQRRPRRSKTLVSSVTNTASTPELGGRSGSPTNSTAAHSHDRSETSVENHHATTSISTTPSIPTVSSRSTLPEPTQSLGSREAIELMINDYLDLLYPLMPIVHRPSFRADVGRERADHDRGFCSLLLSICAMVVAQLPRRFLEYKKAQWFFDFHTPKQLVVHLEERVLGLRSQDYFETPTIQKCAIAFFLACSYGSLNIVGRMSMYWAEMWVMLRAIGANDPQTYVGLDFVEAQLRKKAFWLYVFYSVHDRVGGPQRPSLLWKPLPDQMLFDSDHLAALLPLDLDDEYITPNLLYQQPPSETPLATGFTGLIHVFLCLMDLPQEVVGGPKISRSTTTAREPSDQYNNRADYQVLKRMFERVKYVLDDISPQMALWQGEWTGSDSANTSEASVTRSDQIESLRANLQVTRLWVRSLIFERLLAIYQAATAATAGTATAMPTELSRSHEREHWSEREDTCEQLLAVLYNIKQKNLEPNGITLTYKIRQVAATLLDCPFEEHTSISRRARLYIERFMELLTLLDKYSFQDTQLVVWSDFDTQERHPASDFMPLSGV